jgi:hypothetical protein
MSIARSLTFGRRKHVPGRPHRLHRSKKNRHPWEGKGAPIHGKYRFLIKQKLEQIKIADLEHPDDE